ncbi:Ig-like domain-containing protein [Treponema sp. C6A8]|uniref:Ig-like domain-containing protein n=1 Tax=Treponema sp. C6A8 TaxID=1410609 RepID=UPI0004890189|nr:Ig-like domain-containing protein [Treponema sp. C6A8]
MKFRNFFIGALAALSIFIIFPTCEIGLGESVDTEAPSVRILTPETSAVLRGSVNLTGSWSDDQGISRVAVNITNVTKEQAVISGANANVGTNSTWDYQLYTQTSTSVPSGAAVLPDGKYEAKVSAFDRAGHASGEASRTFEIDGTAPVVALSKPASVNAASPSTYGRTIKITGLISDDHAVPTIKISVYKNDGTLINLKDNGGKDSFTDFDPSDTSVTIAKYYTDEQLQNIDTSSDEYKLYKNYLLMFDDTIKTDGKNDSKTLTIVVTAIDKAGNETERAFLKTNMLNLVQKKAGKSLEMADLKNILNGSYNGTVQNMDVIKSILNGEYEIDTTITDETQIERPYVADSNTKLVFSINPDANPTYEFRNYTYDTSFTEIEEAGILTLLVNCGLDGTSFYPKTLGLKITKIDNGLSFSNLDAKFISNGQTDISNDDNATTDATYSVDLGKISTYINDNYVTASDTTYKDFIENGKTYKIEVTGKDGDGNDFIPSGNKKYGFLVKASTASSEIDCSWDNTYKKADILSSTKNIPIIVTDDSVNASVTINAWVNYYYDCDVDEDENIKTDENKITLSGNPYTGSRKEIYIPIKDIKESNTTFKNCTIKLTVQSVKTGAKTKEKSFIIYADNAAPVLKFTNKELQDTSKEIYVFDDESYYMDGSSKVSGNYYYGAIEENTYSINGTWEDRYSYTTQGVTTTKYGNGSGGKQLYYIIDSGEPKKVSEEDSYVTKPATWSLDLKNTVITEGEHSIIFKTEDAAGNTTKDTYKINKIIFDFSKPAIDVSEVKKGETVVTDYTYLKNDETLTITGAYSDTYGISSLSCTANKVGESAPVTSGNSGYNFTDTRAEDGKSGTFTITLAADDNNNGKWTFDLTVVDKAGRSRKLDTIKTIVDTKKPVWKADSFTVNKVAYSESETNWYKSSALPFTGTVAENGSGIKEIKYSVIKAGEADNPTYAESIASTKDKDSSNKYTGTESFSANLGEFISKLDADGNAAANKVYMKAVDYAGNESEVQIFKIFVDSESPTFTCEQSGTQVTNGTTNITANGTFDDDASGVKTVTLEVSYTENGTKTTKSFEAELDSTAKTWLCTIPVSELNIDTTYDVKLTVEDVAGNKSSSSVFNIQRDTTKPVFKTPSVEGTSIKYSVYKPNSSENTYFINNTDGKFTISGIATDNFGVEKVELSISGGGGESYTPLADTNGGVYSFENIDFSDWTGTATAILTVTDKAGNTNATPLTITLNFDSTAPKGIHALDDKNKDLYFRIGDYDNELTTLGDDDKDVGGKYSENTFGNANTIKVRGKFDDTDSGSGVSMIYYKVVNAASAMTYSELKKQADNFLAKYNDNTEYTGYFAPIAAAKLPKEKRSVPYTSSTGKIKEKIIDSDGKIADGDDLVSSTTKKTDKNGVEQYYADITTNYSSTLSGFTEGLNYLILVAVDNVGNAALDKVITGSVGDDASTSEKIYYNASLNVDTATPSSTTTSEIQYTNGEEGCADITVSGTATDASAGVRSVEISVNGKTIKVGETTYGTLTLNGNVGDKSRTWSVTIKAHEVFGDSSTTNGSKSISAVVIDNAGSGNKNTVPVASVMVDKTAPTVKLTAPTDADSETADIQVNGKISMSGTISDGNVLPATAITGLQYIQSDSEPASTASWTDATLYQAAKEAEGDTPAQAEVQGVKLSGSYTFKIEDFDTTKLTDGKTYWIRAVAKDKAGNTGYSSAQKVIVSQDTDRPKINISNLSYDSTMGYLLQYGTNAQVKGRISDDDSTSTSVVKTFILSSTSYNGEGTAPTTLVKSYNATTGEFTFEPADTNDGEKTFYIYIEDNGDGKFYSKYTSVSGAVTKNDYLKNPKIYINDERPTKTEGTGSSAKTVIDESVNEKEFTYHSDSKSPTPGVGKGLPYYLDGTTKNLAKDDSNVEFDLNKDNSNLNANFALGGSARKYVKFYFTATDASGIGGMTLKISDMEASPTVKLRLKTADAITGASTDSSDSELYTLDVGAGKGNWSGTTNESSAASWTTDYIDISSWTTGQYTVEVKSYDRVGNSATDSKTFYVDNTAPSITVGSPENGEEKTGVIKIAGTTTETGKAGLESIKWLIPTSAQVFEATTKSTELNNTERLEYLRTLTGWSNKLAAQKTVSAWQFDFDGAEGGNPTFETYDNSIYATPVNGIYKLPVYFMATDKFGNYTIKQNYTINHNPDGDKPKVTITYPTKENYDTGLTYATLGGAISVTGSAEIPSGTTTVKKVYLQIANDTGAFNTADKTIAKDNYGFTVVNAYDVIKTIKGTEYTSSGTGDNVMTDAIAATFGFADKAALDAWWGIEVSNTTSWRIQINADSKMNPTGTNDTNDIKIRACGVNANGKFGAWTTEDGVVSIHIDNKVPVLSVVVKQYSSAITPTSEENPSVLTEDPLSIASQNYAADMFLRGDNWYLVLDSRDESGIETVSIKNNGAAVSGCYEMALGAVDGKSGKRVYIPINTSLTSVAYDVVATEVQAAGANSAHSTKASYSFKIDNSAPSLDDIKNGKEEDLSLTEQNSVKNNNYIYTIKGSSDDGEDGSGVENIVFYYMRKKGTTQTTISNEVLLDSMIAPTTTTTNGVTTTTYGSKVTLGELTSIDLGLGDGKPVLYAKSVSGAVSADNNGSFNTFTASSALGDHIRVGGLVKIDGLLRKISAIDGTKVTFTPATTAENASATALFPIAQVIDANNTAKQNQKKDGKFEFDTGKDDGDGMPESFSKSGSKWSWDASIHSDNIPDGPATLVILAFDKAGNVAGKAYKMMVSNNAPRLAKVFLATDLNHDDAYTDNEFETYNIAAATGNTDGEEAYELTTADFKKYNMNSKLEWAETTGTRNAFTIKKNLAILPEFVGGNGDVKLVFKKDDTGTDLTGITGSGTELRSATGTFTPTTAMVGVSDVSEEDRNKTDSIKNSLTAKSYWVIPADSLGDDVASKSMSFTFWDTTEECTQGTNSQYAFLRVKDFIVDQVDNVAPNVVVNPFFWEGEGEGKNSLYGGKASNGHIELEDDLSDTVKTLYGDDPKVSGKIVLRGSVYDDTLLGGLSFSMTNFDSSTTTPISVATYGTTGWTISKVGENNPTMASNYYEVTVEDAYINQNGHKANWTIAIDTAHLSDVAHLNAEFTVIAVDQKTDTANSSANSTGTSEGTTDATKHKPSYTMDVVPYITAIHTSNRTKSGLKDNNIRSASGKYSIMYAASTSASTYAEDFITVKGFNLSPSAVRVVNSTTAAGTVTDSSGVGVTTKASSIAAPYTSFTASNVISKSGYLEVFVTDSSSNKIRSLNNINNNDAHGSFTRTSSVEDYKSMPNRVNEADFYTTKNIRLTDDRYLRVFDMKSTTIKNGYYPDMIVNQKNTTDGAGNIVFSYLNPTGGSGMSYSANFQPQRSVVTVGTGATKSTEYLIGGMAWDQMSMAQDDSGRYLHVTSYNYNEASMSLIYDRFSALTMKTYKHGDSSTYGYDDTYGGWGSGTFWNGQYLTPSHLSNNNALTLDSVNYSSLLLDRYKNLRLIAQGDSTSSTDPARVYFGFYDDNSGTVYFRNMKIGTESSLGNQLYKSSSYNNGTRKASDGGNYTQYTNLNENSSNSTTWTNGKSTVATSSTEHFDIGVDSNKVAVVVYYGADGKLHLKYKTGVDGSSPNTALTFTENTDVSFPDGVGQYVSMAIDSSNGIHIAAFDANNSDLMYIYMTAYNAKTYTKMLVDAAGSVGNWTQIKIKNNKPYIAYYNSTETGGRDTIKLAYSNAAIGSISDGIDSSTNYTSTGWEYMTVPSITPAQGGNVKFRHVNLDFDSSGTPVVGYLGSYLEYGKWLTE